MLSHKLVQISFYHPSFNGKCFWAKIILKLDLRFSFNRTKDASERAKKQMTVSVKGYQTLSTSEIYKKKKRIDILLTFMQKNMAIYFHSHSIFYLNF